jgi:hypothetical protein
MPNLIRLLFLTIVAAATALAQELPAPSSKSLEFEPQLILTDPNAPPAGGVTTDVAKLENGLQRAKRDAVAHAALFKKGILAKLEVEKTEMRVVLLTKKLSEARLQIARDALEKLAGGSKEAKTAAEEAVRQAEAVARADAAAYRKAQIEAAALNLSRQQKLQAWGSASKATVARAQEQLSALQAPPKDAVETTTQAPAATNITP